MYLSQKIDAIKLSEDLLRAVKLNKPTFTLEFALKHIDLTELQKQLYSDDRKKAFWINIYNAFYQILARNFRHEKSLIYSIKLFMIAGHEFSLDDVEHGILRRFKYKYGLGYLPQLFPSKVLKSLAVVSVDYRIHFALNCGAASCPPILFYDPIDIDNQLQMAMVSFLEAETSFDNDKKTVNVTRLFLWFMGDFGGINNVRKIISETLMIDIDGFRVKFNPYSWEEKLGNFFQTNQVA
ncbi:DUF547 domain-containing protein [Flammeovirga sp. SJP92]|uniref:DUF547 domain-containing protein n=1 Tax=Flammeovirga sp. SJP92 TaxID=1775430 RepID=UPI00078843BB|nr:DUF547 domain-containing protein [Flammeovirga sp. SJP92]KXX70700.1 hypothetical protein AVL50_07755 [Flammeovirga sp. SJP92]